MTKRNNNARKKIPELKNFLNGLSGKANEDDELSLRNIVRDPNITQVITELQAILEALDKRENPADGTEKLHLFMPLLTDMITGVWRSQQKMVVRGTQDPSPEFRKPYRPLVSVCDRWSQAGFEVKDRTNEPYDIGLLEKVITYQPVEGLHREIIIETMKPSIYYYGRLVQQGEIIVGIPDNSGQLR